MHPSVHPDAQGKCPDGSKPDAQGKCIPKPFCLKGVFHLVGINASLTQIVIMTRAMYMRVMNMAGLLKERDWL